MNLWDKFIITSFRCVHPRNFGNKNRKNGNSARIFVLAAGRDTVLFTCSSNCCIRTSFMSYLYHIITLIKNLDIYLNYQYKAFKYYCLVCVPRTYRLSATIFHIIFNTPTLNVKCGRTAHPFELWRCSIICSVSLNNAFSNDILPNPKSLSVLCMNRRWFWYASLSLNIIPEM